MDTLVEVHAQAVARQLVNKRLKEMAVIIAQIQQNAGRCPIPDRLQHLPELREELPLPGDPAVLRQNIASYQDKRWAFTLRRFDQCFPFPTELV
jgi:hypothetical protein